MRTRALVIGLLSALLLAPAPPRSSASTSGAERYQYVHPLPGSRLVSPRNNIVIRQGDFLDLGSRQAVDVALHRLVKRKIIRRLARGIYEYPREHPELGTGLIHGLAIIL